MKRILIISVHPDDETLGCGGTILKHRSCGDKNYWLILTNISDEDKWGRGKIKERQLEIGEINKRYGFEKVIKLNYETTKLDELPLSILTEKLTEVIREIRPEIIYLHNRSDIHSDHQISFKAILSATKTFNNEYLSSLLMYETISETEFSPPFQENAFQPNYFVDITNYLDEKIDIMRIYKSEIKEPPFPRSVENIRALATFRGSQAGVKHAEAFMIIKNIWK